MTTLQHSSTNQNNKKSIRKCTLASKSYCNLNRKCGEITFYTQMDKRVYTLNCLYCPQICLQLDIFINHMEKEHDEDLINALQMNKDENELQMYNMQNDNSEDLQENETTTFSKEPDESNQVSINDPLEDDNSTSALSLECSIKNEKIDYDTPIQTIVDDNMDNSICKTEIHIDDEEENNNPKTKRYQFGENLILHDNPNATQCCQIWKRLCDAKFEQLTESVKQLKSSIEELTANIVQQNIVVMETLATQKELTERSLGNDKVEANIRKVFPIQTADELEDCNAKINEANRTAYIRCMSSLLKGQLHKSLTAIFSVNLIVASNIDGVHGKVSLKSFKRLYDILMDSIRANGEENPEKEIRHAFKLVKKRHFQAMCVNKKKESSGNNN
ncbi:uncharacterized protein LOC119601737 isoform X3 [Lucilia sericata]|uniref:uncharacterized protein LOC119601737 isoform X3 n=1 Tax=Lucilia sericata TaxID=13632 RepID=UPI0018A85F4E|nr:uncharacterized protein LOC119601737 isoform X3 [Lucilia sericata]